MTRVSAGAIEAGATHQGARERSVRTAISAAMLAVEKKLQNKAAAQLAAILGCDEKSARRLLRGERIPAGENSFGMIMNAQIGPDMLLAATWNLPPREFEEFWDAMDDARHRARQRDRQDRLSTPPAR